MSKLKIAVVIGASSGIGRATARLLAARDYRVYGTGVSAAEVRQGRAEPANQGIEFDCLDVADGAAVNTYFGQFSQLDALVNCAGIGAGSAEFNEAGFTNTIDINLNGTMRCCYAAETALKAAAGAVVNLASVMSVFGSASAPAYAASKGGVLQFSKSLAVAWGEAGVRVNAVAPGWIETPMTSAMQANAERNRRVLERSPLRRWGKPEEIAAGIVFLLSPEASFINGALIPIDGGYLAVGI